ncbi:hypothetical protein Hanom_Chr00s000003g01605801 [Helianthus anomalus]
MHSHCHCNSLSPEPTAQFRLHILFSITLHPLWITFESSRGRLQNLMGVLGILTRV